MSWPTGCMLGTHSYVHHSLHLVSKGRKVWTWVVGSRKVHGTKFFSLDVLGSCFGKHLCSSVTPLIPRNSTANFWPSAETQTTSACFWWLRFQQQIFNSNTFVLAWVLFLSSCSGIVYGSGASALKSHMYFLLTCSSTAVQTKVGLRGFLSWWGGDICPKREIEMM